MTTHRPHAFYRLSPQVRPETETITLRDNQGREHRTHRLSARVRRQIADARRSPAYWRLFEPYPAAGADVRVLIDRSFPTVFIEACQPEHHAWTVIRAGMEMCAICHRINPQSLIQARPVAQSIPSQLPLATGY